MKTKNSFFALLLICAYFVLISVTTSAQPEPKEKIKSYKIAFITEKLNLTVEEAQSFWPVYNEFEAKREELNDKKRAIIDGARDNFRTMSDAQIEERSDQFIEFQLTEALLQKEYHARFKKVLPIEKVIRLYIAEHKFREFLLEKMREPGRGGRH